MADLPLASCPEQVTEKIMAAIGNKSTAAVSPAGKSRRLNPILGWAAAAAAAVLIVTSPLVSDRSGNTPDQVAVPEFTPEEIQAARLDAERGLLLAARILSRTERSTVKEVFGQTLPESLSRSIKSIINTPEGEQG